MQTRVDFLTPEIVRLRKFAGDTPPEQPLIRYGFFRDSWEAVATETTEDGDQVTISSSALTVSINKATGEVVISDASGTELLRSAEAPVVEEDLTEARFVLPAERTFYGLGDQQRERLELRGTLGDLWVRNVTGYIPIPFWWTPDGFGLLVNSTRRLIVDLGHSSPEWFGFRQPGGCLDYYFIHGPSPRQIIERYTDVTGKPPLPPKWAFGLWFICRTQANDREFMEDCLKFRDRDIPCDAISLEPGWMEKNYDYSITKDWNRERFPVPSYDRNPGRYTFMRAARRMGFKPGLWLCMDYDVSYEAERRVQAKLEVTTDTAEKRGFEQDEHLAGARRMDQLTKPEEPWFQHLKDFVDQGVEWFKQDGSNQVLDHPDRLYGNGMRDDEMHNLYPLLYSQQMYEGFAEHTGRRPFGFTVAGWAGLQRWTATWTGDTGGEEGPLVGCLNMALSGHGMNTVDMEVTTKAGIHFGFMLPWAQLNSWNYFRHPWFQGEELEGFFRRCAQTRYDLIPYLYSLAHQASLTGIPMMRPMPLLWPHDPEAPKCLRQFMLGDDLLAACFADEVYLPEGLWHHYDDLDEKPLQGGRWLTLKDREEQGALLVRHGAILPVDQAEHRYDGSHAHVGDDRRYAQGYSLWPAERGETVLYEDDGLTFGYEQGQCRTTRASYEQTDKRLVVKIRAPEGSYPDAPQTRWLDLNFHGIREPERVVVNGSDEGFEKGFDGGFGWITVGDNPVDRLTTVELFY